MGTKVETSEIPKICETLSPNDEEPSFEQNNTDNMEISTYVKPKRIAPKPETGVRSIQSKLEILDENTNSEIFPGEKNDIQVEPVFGKSVPIESTLNFTTTEILSEIYPKDKPEPVKETVEQSIEIEIKKTIPETAKIMVETPIASAAQSFHRPVEKSAALLPELPNGKPSEKALLTVSVNINVTTSDNADAETKITSIDVVKNVSETSEADLTPTWRKKIKTKPDISEEKNPLDKDGNTSSKTTKKPDKTLTNTITEVSKKTTDRAIKASKPSVVLLPREEESSSEERNDESLKLDHGTNEISEKVPSANEVEFVPALREEKDETPKTLEKQITSAMNPDRTTEHFLQPKEKSEEKVLMKQPIKIKLIKTSLDTAESVIGKFENPESDVTQTPLQEILPEKSKPKYSTKLEATIETLKTSKAILPQEEDHLTQETNVQLTKKPDEQFTESAQTTITKVIRKKSKKPSPEVTEIVDETHLVPEETIELFPLQEKNVHQDQKPDIQFTEETKVTVTKLTKNKQKKQLRKVDEIVDETSEVPELSVDHLSDRKNSSPVETEVKQVQKPDDQFTEETQVRVTKIMKNKSKKTSPDGIEIVDKTSEESVEKLPLHEESLPQDSDVQSTKNTDKHITEECQVTFTKIIRNKPKKTTTKLTEIVDETSEIPEHSVDHLSDQNDSSPEETDVQLVLKPDNQFTVEAQPAVTKIMKKKSKKTAPEVTEIVDETSELPEPTVDQLPDREDSSPQETILQLAQKPNEQFTEETQTTVIKITKKKSKKTVPEITEIM